MGSYEHVFLQMQPNVIPQLEIVWNPMLVMSLCLHSIVLFQNVMHLLEDVLDSIKKYGGIISLSLSMGMFLV